MRTVTGFTLLEMTLVVAIMGILATVAIGAYLASQQKGRDAQRKSDLAQVVRALEGYVADHGTYPGETGKRLAACGGTGDETCGWGEEFSDENGTVYMKRLVKDPSGSQYYVYEVSSDRKQYQLYALLENRNDPARGSYSQVCATTGAKCNYGVASSNATPSEVLE